jgi:hypothetical protein
MMGVAWARREAHEGVAEPGARGESTGAPGRCVEQRSDETCAVIPYTFSKRETFEGAVTAQVCSPDTK